MLLIREIAPDRLWLLANSMGGQVVVDALRALHRDPDFADSDVEIDLVVLTAPDVDHRKFNEQFKGEIDALTRNLTVYVSSNGRALMMSRIINGSKRLGESTLGGLSPDQFAEAATIAELVEPGDELVTLVDVTPVNRTGNFHNFSLETPKFFDDPFLRLSNTDMPKSRLNYAVRGRDGSVYWILTSGRR